MLTSTPYPVGQVFVTLGDASGNAAASVVLEITGGSTFTLTPRGRHRRSKAPLDTTAPGIYYQNLTTGQGTSGATPITADGLYEITADGLRLGLDLAVTAGTAVLAASPVFDA